MGQYTAINVTLVFPCIFPFSVEEWRELKSQELPQIPSQLPSQLPELDALSLFLSRAEREHANQLEFESLLYSLFGIRQRDNISIAALTYMHDKGEVPQKTVLRADPVYLKPDRDCLYLLGSDNLNVTPEEANKLISEVNMLYHDTDWQLEMGTSNRWYICSDSEIPIKTSTLNDAFGKNIEPYLPQGDDGKKWRGLITEWQMLFHNSSVNLQREAAGRLPVNSVWIWGEGEMPSQHSDKPQHWSHVWSNDALCGGLATWANCEKHRLPASSSEWAEQAATGNHLVVFDDLRVMARVDYQAWINAMTELEEQWLKPMMDNIKNNRIGKMTIEVGNGMRMVVTRSSIKKWWKKIRPWYDWIT